MTGVTGVIVFHVFSIFNGPFLFGLAASFRALGQTDCGRTISCFKLSVSRRPTWSTGLEGHEAFGGWGCDVVTFRR